MSWPILAGELGTALSVVVTSVSEYQRRKRRRRYERILQRLDNALRGYQRRHAATRWATCMDRRQPSFRSSLLDLDNVMPSLILIIMVLGIMSCVGKM